MFKNKLNELVEQKIKSFSVMFECVEGICNYLLTDINKNYYYRIGIVSDLLQTKEPIFVERGINNIL